MRQIRLEFDKEREDREGWQQRLRDRLRVHDRHGPLTDEQAGHLCGERVAGNPYHTPSVWLRANGYLAHVQEFRVSSANGRQQCSVITEAGCRAMALPVSIRIPPKKRRK